MQQPQSSLWQFYCSIVILHQQQEQQEQVPREKYEKGNVRRGNLGVEIILQTL